MSPEEEISAYIQRIERTVHEDCPAWLTPNSNWFGIMPGHNLDLLQIAFDFKINRSHVLKSSPDGVPAYLTDPSKPELKVIK